MASFDEIARKDKFGKAVRTDHIEHKGVVRKADLVKPLYGDGYWYYANTGVKIRKATAAEIDGDWPWRTFATTSKS